MGPDCSSDHMVEGPGLCRGEGTASPPGGFKTWDALLQTSTCKMAGRLLPVLCVELIVQGSGDLWFWLVGHRYPHSGGQMHHTRDAGEPVSTWLFAMPLSLRTRAP